MADPFDFRRAVMGAISLCFVSIGVSAYALGLDAPVYWVLLRSGLFMGAFWLALPDLTSQDSKLNVPTLVLGVVLIVVVATKPKLMVILGSIAIAAFFLQGAVRRFTKRLMK